MPPVLPHAAGARRPRLEGLERRDESHRRVAEEFGERREQPIGLDRAVGERRHERREEEARDHDRARRHRVEVEPQPVLPQPRDDERRVEERREDVDPRRACEEPVNLAVAPHRARDAPRRRLAARRRAPQRIAQVVDAQEELDRALVLLPLPRCARLAATLSGTVPSASRVSARRLRPRVVLAKIRRGPALRVECRPVQKSSPPCRTAAARSSRAPRAARPRWCRRTCTSRSHPSRASPSRRRLAFSCESGCDEHQQPTTAASVQVSAFRAGDPVLALLRFLRAARHGEARRRAGASR